ncbi:MAG TPA: trehalose-6-phosphate synthase, partial [Pseudomonadota bacterium]|nr:trehalose-6-phosphate synthase [Pseudomonadota bacterium]
IHIARFELAPPGVPPVRVMIAQDLSPAGRHLTALRDYVLAFAAVSTFSLISLVALTAWWLLRRWASILINDIRSGRFLDDARSPSLSMPILSRVREALKEVEARQRLEIDYQENWTPLALQQVVRTQVRAEQIIVVSNRQPYSHVYAADGSVQVQIPASGMVTALEPIIRACSGVWIAHGSGSADRDVVDRNDRIAVPPGEPSYSLRRVWLTPEEEEGYYYGFSNEGLWSLCHIAYVRPAFRPADWEAYQAVNRKFATVVAGEATCARPVVLIQDFHFALLPLLIRERLPRATIVLFWHVPWPNAETFGVCPWKVEILRHMLRADILGFHTRYHCQNFLATVDRFIECQIDHVHMTVTSSGRVCQVMAYPISIEWPPRWLSAVADPAAARAAVGRRYGIADSVKLLVGVERWDFTKGIIERFRALEVFLERHGAMRERITLLQIAAPSRSKLPAYQALQRQCLAEVDRINLRFGTGGWKPIVLIDEHQPPESVFEVYRAADVCLVTSLHDGMNLVAKEFVAARDDEDGVLILSTFAGAAQELGEALLVNPFDVTEMARAIESALEMPRVERRERMKLLRRTVKVNNVFRWAGRMLMDAAKIRQHQFLRSGRSMTGTQ